MRPYEAVAALLKIAGWRDTGDAQWEGLRNAIPQIMVELSIADPTEIADLKEKIGELEESTDREMDLDRAERLAGLWAAGKLIGGDAPAACVALHQELRRLRKEKKPEESSFGFAWFM